MANKALSSYYTKYCLLPLACVHHSVSLETCRVLVGLSTVCTLVGSRKRYGKLSIQLFFKNKYFLIPDIAVCRDVGIEVGGVAKCLVAVGALVGRGGAVSGLVLLKMCLLSEFLLANSTLEWSLSY